MIALSVRQPWAWMIVNGWKDTENRGWPTGVRGRVLIHAAKTMRRRDWFEAAFFAWAIMNKWVPYPEELERGGIVGSVELVACVTRSESRWFVGPYGFALRDPQVLPFRQYHGQLGFFQVAA